MVDPHPSLLLLTLISHDSDRIRGCIKMRADKRHVAGWTVEMCLVLPFKSVFAYRLDLVSWQLQLALAKIKSLSLTPLPCYCHASNSGLACWRTIQSFCHSSKQPANCETCEYCSRPCNPQPIARWQRTRDKPGLAQISRTTQPTCRLWGDEGLLLCATENGGCLLHSITESMDN
jgi:hypothetical protein